MPGEQRGQHNRASASQRHPDDVGVGGRTNGGGPGWFNQLIKLWLAYTLATFALKMYRVYWVGVSRRLFGRSGALAAAICCEDPL